MLGEGRHQRGAAVIEMDDFGALDAEADLHAAVGGGVEMEGGAAQQAHAVGLFEVGAGVVARAPEELAGLLVGTQHQHRHLAIGGVTHQDMAVGVRQFEKGGAHVFRPREQEFRIAGIQHSGVLGK